MHQNRRTRDGKPETRSADLSGMGLIDTVETLKDLILILLRDSDAGVLYLNKEEGTVDIQGYMHPAVVLVVLDAVFHQIGNGKGQLRTVNLGYDRLIALQGDLNPAPCGDRTKTLQNQCDQVVNVGLLDMDIRGSPVHLDQLEQIGDDLVLPVDLLADILHEFLVHLIRNFSELRLLDQGIREDLHGSHGRFQFMGDVRDEFLTGFLLGLQPAAHLIVSVREKLRLRIIRHGNIIPHEFRTGIQICRHLPEGADQNAGCIERSRDDHQCQNQLEHRDRTGQRRLSFNYIRGRYRKDKSSENPFRYFVHNRTDHFYEIARPVIIIRIIPLKTADQLLRYNRFILVKSVGITDDAEKAVYNNHTPAVEVAQLFQLGLNDIRRLAVQVMGGSQLPPDHPALAADHGRAL